MILSSGVMGQLACPLHTLEACPNDEGGRLVSVEAREHPVFLENATPAALLEALVDLAGPVLSARVFMDCGEPRRLAPLAVLVEATSSRDNAEVESDNIVL